MKETGIPWLGKIPDDWKVAAIKREFTVYAGSTPDSKTPEYWNGDVIWVTPADFKTQDQYVSCGKRNLSKAGYESCGTTIVPAGSIIFSKRAPIGTVCISTQSMCTNQGCLSCVPKTDLNVKYYYYLISIATEAFELEGSGTTFKEISLNKYMNFKIPVPSIESQTNITKYLDVHVSRIDFIISEAQKSIEEYKTLKQSVITEAVTKGLDKNVPMHKCSDWLEQCPDKWDVKQIRYIYELRNERNNKPLDEVNLLSLYTDQGVVQHGDLEKTVGNKAMTADGYKRVYPEDIVVNIILCWMGAMGMSKYEGVTSPAYDIYKPINRNEVNSRYYHYLFRTDRFSKKCYTVGRGIMMMRWRTYSSEFRSIKVPVPSYEEQTKIADYLDMQIEKIDTIISEKHSLIGDLQAYKQSLIYEVVTGKRKVVS